MLVRAAVKPLVGQPPPGAVVLEVAEVDVGLTAVVTGAVVPAGTVDAAVLLVVPGDVDRGDVPWHPAAANAITQTMTGITVGLRLTHAMIGP